jgi:hypothetical protein
MPNYVGQPVADYGLNAIIAACSDSVAMVVLKTYNYGDDYATVGSNVIGTVAMIASDFAIEDVPAAAGRRIRVDTKTVTMTDDSGASPDIHVAILDTSAEKVLAVNDESTDVEMLTDDVFHIPVWYIPMLWPSS